MNARIREALKLVPSRHEEAAAGPRTSTLLRRVFAVNATLLCVSAVVTVIIFPGFVSSLIAIRELVVLVVALTVMLVVNFLLLRRAFEPLRRLTELIERVDPRRPGQRVAFPSDGSEPSRLAEAFDEMLDRLEKERRESGGRALAAQESERLRVAQELHDEIGQSLTALLLQLEHTGRRAPSELGDELSEARETARTSIEEVRRIAQRLRPELLDHLGLAAALADFGDRLAERTGLRVDSQLKRDLPPLSYQQELVVYRVAQEALTNVVRHSGSEEVEIHLARSDGELLVRVADRGRGFTGAGDEGHGIQGMYERALLIDATVSVEERPGGGVVVSLRLPLDETAA